MQTSLSHSNNPVHYQTAFSIESKANPFSLSCFILARKYVFINLNFEKLRCPEATVTGLLKQHAKQLKRFERPHANDSNVSSAKDQERLNTIGHDITQRS